MASLAARRASIARILMRVSESTPAGGCGGAATGAGAAGGAAAGLGGAATATGAGGGGGAGACAAGWGRRITGWLKGVGADAGAPLGSPVGLGSGGICLVALQDRRGASKVSKPATNTHWPRCPLHAGNTKGVIS
jgi:hypothetical protein